MSVADQPEDILDSGEAGGRAIRGGALFSGTYVVGLLLSIASVPFMIRHLGVVDYGYYVAVSAIVFIIGGFTEAGLTNLGIREYSQLRPGEREPFLRNLVGLRLVLTAVGVALATALTAVTGAAGIVVLGVAITGFGLLVQLTQATYTVPLNVQLRMGWISILGVIRAGGAVRAVHPAGRPQRGARRVLLGQRRDRRRGRRRDPARAARDGAAAAVVPRGRVEEDPQGDAAVRARGGGRPHLLPDRRRADVLRLDGRGDRHTSPPRSASSRSSASLPWMLVSAGFPILARAARDDEARLGYALQKIFEVATVLGAFIALGLAVAAPLAISVVAGPDFDESIPVLRLQAAGLVTSFLMVTWTYALLSLRLYRPLLIANAASPPCAIVATSSSRRRWARRARRSRPCSPRRRWPASRCRGCAGAGRRSRRSWAWSRRSCWRWSSRSGSRWSCRPRRSCSRSSAGGVYAAIVFALRAVPPEAIAALRRQA